ncbi:hypothetical protein GCM10022241_13740 [Micrococcus endophyticus]
MGMLQLLGVVDSGGLGARDGAAPSPSSYPRGAADPRARRRTTAARQATTTARPGDARPTGDGDARPSGDGDAAGA